MREAVDMMDFVNACYGVGIVSTLALVGWSWTAMVRAEKKREETRRK
ncbi:hypothetical protein GCM10009127_23160 [Alteraurantiacibacter aestuarii]